jgi:hypothetical protein
MQAHIFRFVATALQCGALGLLIYIAVSEGARYPGLFVGVLGSTISGALAILLTREIAAKLRTGVAPARPLAISRRREPFSSWGWLLFHSVCLAACLALLVWCLHHLLSELTAGP